MFCPSSPLPRFVLTSEEHGTANTASATYTGVSGALDHPVDPRQGPQRRGLRQDLWGGALVMNEAVAIRDLTDGTTNTMMVAEQSGWCIDGDGSKMDCRSDCWHGFPPWAPAATAGSGRST